MFRVQCVIVVVALYVGIALSWDFAVSSGDQLTFHTNNGTEIDRVRIQSRNLGGLAYDVVHNRMLYVDKQNNNDSICGYNLSSKINECFIGRSGRNILSIAYDPGTEKLFFTDANEKSINWISLKSGYKNGLYGNLLIKMDDRTPDDIAVDSCRGYIYWSNSGQSYIVEDTERACFNGSDRMALSIDGNYNDVCSLTIDPKTQTIYYLVCNRYKQSMNTADKYGTHENFKFHGYWSEAKELTVSKDYVYFITYKHGQSYKSVYQLSKKGEDFVDPEEISKFYTTGFLGLAANYKIEDQIEGIPECDSLSNLIPTIKAPGTCEQHDVCVNYCFEGSCSVNDGGLPNCSCNSGYSGERCEVYSCHGYCLNDGECSLNEEDVPVCRCTGNHEGARCEADVTDTTPTYDLANRNITVADLLSIWGKRSSRTFVTFEIQP